MKPDPTIVGKRTCDDDTDVYFFVGPKPSEALQCRLCRHGAAGASAYCNLEHPCGHVIEAIRVGADVCVMDDYVVVPIVQKVNLPGGAAVPFSVRVTLSTPDKAGVRAAYFDSEFMNTRLGYVVKGDGRRALRNLIIPALDAARDWGLPSCSNQYHDRTFSAMLNQAGERAALLAETYTLAVHNRCAHCYFVGTDINDLVPTV